MDGRKTPVIDTSLVKIPVAFMYGEFDSLSTPKDNKILIDTIDPSLVVFNKQYKFDHFSLVLPLNSTELNADLL